MSILPHRLVIAAMLCAMATLATAAAAAQPTYEFNLPQQSLAEALKAIGRQTAVNILFEAGAVKDMTAPEVHGTLSAEEAIRRALSRTKLVVDAMADNAIIVAPPRTSAANSASADALLRMSEVGLVLRDFQLAQNDQNTQTTENKSSENSDSSAEDPGSKPQDTDTSYSSPFEIQEVVVQAGRERGYGALAGTTGRLATSYLDIPQASSIVTSEFLRDAKIFSITDAVFFVPGIRPFTGMFGGYVIRGLTGFGSLVDGITATSGLTMDTFFYDRIEVVKGPSSVAFGRGDPAGFVNHVSKKPQFKEGTEVELVMGSGNDRRNTYRGTLEREGFLSQDHQTAYRFLALLDEGAQSMNNIGNYRRAGAQLAVSHRLNEGKGQLNVIGSYQAGRIPGTLDFGVLSNKYYFQAIKYYSEFTFGATGIPDFPLYAGNDVPGYDPAVLDQDTFKLTSVFDYKLTDHWHTRLAGAVSSSKQMGDFFQTNALFDPESITADGQSLSAFLFTTTFDNKDISKVVQADLLGEYDLDAIGAKLSLLTGADNTWKNAWSNGFNSFRLGGYRDLRTWDPNAPLGPYPDDRSDIGGDEDRADSSAYVQVQLKFLHDKVQLTAAGRKNWTSGDFRQRGSGAVTSLDAHSPLLPTYSLLLKPREWLTLYATHSEYSVPPAIQKAWTILATTEALIPADDPIRDEVVVVQTTNQQNEIGAKASLFDGKLVLSLARFETDISGDYVAAFETHPLPNGEITLYHLTPSPSAVEGWEFEGFGQVGQRLTYMFGAALGSKGRIHSAFNGLPIDTIKPFFGDSVSGYLTYSFGPNRREGLSITVGGKANLSGWLIANQDVAPDVPETTYRKTEYFLDLGASYGFLGGKYEVFVKGNNINNKDAMPYSNAMLVSGRQIFAGVTAKF